MKPIRSVNVVIWTLVLGAALVATLFGPLLLSVWRAQGYEHRAGPPELQRIVERADDAGSIASRYRAFPYGSISLEAGGCLGPCPPYMLTLYRDGRALLVTDHLLPNKKQAFTSRISPSVYARVTQLVFLARAASHEQHYSGGWTDDSEQVVRATSIGGTWEVSDYGEVSPPEVWALIQVLRSIRQSVEWTALKPQANNSFKPKPLRGSA
jgi:hypothetical protein